MAGFFLPVMDLIFFFAHWPHYCDDDFHSAIGLSAAAPKDPAKFSKIFTNVRIFAGSPEEMKQLH